PIIMILSIQNILATSVCQAGFSARRRVALRTRAWFATVTGMSDPNEIVVGLHQLRPDVSHPGYQSSGAAAVDLAAAADVTVPSHGLVAVPTGLVFAVPAGHFL